jgi:UDP-4-amino-4,6-dideoxy-N-acetyl-beta-L-altrosamine transaminase
MQSPDDTPWPTPHGRPIPYGRHQITEADIAAVVAVLRSDWLTGGPEVPRLERLWADYVSAPDSVALANGTAALHLAIMALGLRPGQRVLVSPITFAASANCIRYCGGEVDFCDIDPQSACMDIAQAAAKLATAPAETYAGIVLVNYAGWAIDLEPWRALADAHGIWILEDACHAPGASYVTQAGERVRTGSCRFSDATMFSFHSVKHIATGEGGILSVADPLRAERIRRLRTHGITRDSSLMTHAPHGGWYYQMLELGYNYRMSDIQAAMAISQLDRASQLQARRQTLAEYYLTELADLPIALPQVPAQMVHAWHLFVIRVRDAAQRLALYDYLRSVGIFTQIHYIPLHTQPYYQQQGWPLGSLPQAEAFYDQCLTLPLWPGLTDDEQAYVIQHLRLFFDQKD